MPATGTRILTPASTMPVAWEKNPRLPRGVAAVLAALRFAAPAPELLRNLSDAEWKSTLYFCDYASLTLFLGALWREYLPPWVAERIDRNIASNTERIGRVRAAVVEIAAALDARNIEYLLLKGFSHEIDYAPDPYLRVGYDVDLFAPPPSLDLAYSALREIDYVPIEGAENTLADHYPSLIRKTGWEFRGDVFDAGVPAAIDLHYRFWDPATERFDAPGVEQFWERRIRQDGLPVLDAADRLAYAGLHMLRHLFRGGLRPLHVYEIAYFLETKCDDDVFWERWRDLHPGPLRRLQAVAFRLAESWFGCRVAGVPTEEIGHLDEDVSLWFECYPAAPLQSQFHPNKDELWLHLALIESSRDRRQVFFRRTFPAALPTAVSVVYVPDDQVTWRMRFHQKSQFVAHMASRFLHHVRSLPPVIAHGLSWKSRKWSLPAPFWRYLSCSLLYYLGLYQFAVLYNLYLLDLGFREDVLGLVASAFTAGNLAGILPGAYLLNRYGLRRTLFGAVAAAAVAFALRALVSAEPALLATAFASGALNALWVVALAPATAAVAPERARPAAFSLLFGSGIALGIGAGIVAGSLAQWFARTGLASSPMQSKQIVLLAGSACVGMALWPLLHLRIESPPPSPARKYPRGPFIRSFLVAIAVWNIATGLLNPLFNAYFARRFLMPPDRIGAVFSISQIAQAVAILCSPLVLRRLGLIRGVALMQLTTAAALALLAPAQVAPIAAALYAAYMSFQYMSEPGLYSALMNRVPPEQHSGASALNFLVLFAGQSLAATVGGAIVARYGYPPMLGAASALAAIAAWLFWRLPQESR